MDLSRLSFTVDIPHTEEWGSSGLQYDSIKGFLRFIL